MAYRMTPARRAALRKAQLASARRRRKVGKAINRSRNKRLSKKIARVEKKTNKKVQKHAKVFQSNMYTHSQHGGIYTTGRGVKAYNKGVAAHNKGQKKLVALRAKQKKRRR